MSLYYILSMERSKKESLNNNEGEKNIDKSQLIERMRPNLNAKSIQSFLISWSRTVSEKQHAKKKKKKKKVMGRKGFDLFWSLHSRFFHCAARSHVRYSAYTHDAHPTVEDERLLFCYPIHTWGLAGGRRII